MRALLFLCLAPLSGLSAYHRVFDNRPEAVEKRLQSPAECVVDGAPQKAQPAAEKAQEPGEQVYRRYCSVCHSQGIAGAPKTGDEAAWQKRLDQGWPTLMKHAIQGYKGMPAKGHCMKCSDQDIRESIEFMIRHSGIDETSE